MGQAIAVRTDYTAGEVRRFAQRAKDAAQARRLLAIAAVLDGTSREEAAKIGGMDRQTLRDWVIRFNEQGADGLINIPSPGMPPNAIHKAFLARIPTESATQRIGSLHEAAASSGLSSSPGLSCPRDRGSFRPPAHRRHHPGHCGLLERAATLY